MGDTSKERFADTKEAGQISRLREEQEKALIETQDKLHTLEKYRADYLALKKRLHTLPDKVAHDVMVPFGKLAFMPGKLVHTNEILVLLGDNWFAEKSAKQACETVDRRMKALDQQMSEVEKQRQLLQPRLDFTTELKQMAEAKGELVEIKEEYDPEKDRLWREEHRRNVQVYNKQRREEEKQARLQYEAREKKEAQTWHKREAQVAQAQHKTKTQMVERESKIRENSDQDLWDRLEQLERQEEEAGEMERSDSGVSESGSSGAEDSSDQEEGSKKVRWKDEGHKPRDRNKTIYFTHTKTETAKNTTTADTPPSDSIEIQTPADIYRVYCESQPQQPKSILKPTAHPVLVKEDKQEVHEVQKTILPGSVEAFSGSVRERDTSDVSAQLEHTQGSHEQSVISEQPPAKPVSRFKAQRMARR